MFIVWLYLLKNILGFEFSPVKGTCYYNKEDNNLGNAHLYISGLSMIIREHTARPLKHIPIQEITLIYSDLLEDDGASLSSLINLNICHFLQWYHCLLFMQSFGFGLSYKWDSLLLKHVLIT